MESAAARICREAGARVGTNIMVRDMDLLPQDHQDGRRLEVVADGLPLFHGAQLAIDTTLVSPLSRDGLPHLRCSGSRTEKEGEDLSRAHKAVRESQTRGARWRGGRKMV